MEANIYVDKVPTAIMARLTFAERLSAMDQPEEVDDFQAIWHSLRPILIGARMLVVVLIILIGELFDDALVRGLSVGVWGLIVGIPVFVLTSMVITFMDQRAKIGDGNTHARP